MILRKASIRRFGARFGHARVSGPRPTGRRRAQNGRERHTAGHGPAKSRGMHDTTPSGSPAHRSRTWVHAPRRAWRLAALMAAALPMGAMSQVQTEPAEPPIRFSLDGGAQFIAERDPFWGLAQQFAPDAAYPRSFHWLEVFVKPSLTARYPLGSGMTAYGGVSLYATGTIEEDVFVQGNTGRLEIEDAYLGLRGEADGWRWDVSAGAQSYRLGHGFLLASGAGNGFERGAAVTAPRRAWRMAGVARATAGPWTAEAFYVDPNELESGDTGTRLWGVLGQWAPVEGASLGLAHLRVNASSAPYPKAPLTIIEGGRDGLQTTDLIWTFEPRSGALAGLSFTGEAAWQRNERIQLKANGYGMDLGWRLAQVRFTPKISWSYRRFSGDVPETPDRLERFDPLFYDGAPPTWSSGSNGSFAFYNSNLVVHRLRADLVLSPRDFANLSWWKVNADQANSPVQYGQAARLTVTEGGVVLVTGFPSRALTQELYAEYTRVLSPRLFFTAGVAGAIPRDGIKALVPDARSWWGVLGNVSFKF